MKSCLGLLIAAVVMIAVVGAIAGTWYLSSTAEFEKVEAPAK